MEVMTVGTYRMNRTLDVDGRAKLNLKHVSKLQYLLIKGMLTEVPLHCGHTTVLTLN